MSAKVLVMIRTAPIRAPQPTVLDPGDAAPSLLLRYVLATYTGETHSPAARRASQPNRYAAIHEISEEE
jgi:hypothetical protein